MKSRALRTANERHAQRALANELLRLETAAVKQYDAIQKTFDTLEEVRQIREHRNKEELLEVRWLMGEANEQIWRKEAQSPRRLESAWPAVIALSAGMILLGLLLIWRVWSL